MVYCFDKEEGGEFFFQENFFRPSHTTEEIGSHTTLGSLEITRSGLGARCGNFGGSMLDKMVSIGFD